MKKKKTHLPYSFWLSTLLIAIMGMLIFSCSSSSNEKEDINEEGTFLVYRRQSLIGEESFKITTENDLIKVESLQGENERGRITGVKAELHLNKDLSPLFYVNQRIANGDTTNIFKMEIENQEVSIWEKYFDVVTQKAPKNFFPLHSNIPAAMEMMLYQFYQKQSNISRIPTLPRGELSMTHKAKDTVSISGKEIVLDRYVVEGINWGGRTVWLDQDKKLIALVKANTQIRELIRKGYEEALPTFIAGNVIEQMNQLSEYTKDLMKWQSQTTVLLGADVVDGLSETVQKNKALVIQNGKITSIENADGFEIPQYAEVIDVKGKTLIPGLWDMHAHSNQVQWAPAYLAGGVTTIRDNGNEIEFATAFRDAIAKEGMLGPDILLAGMTDGPGAKGNGAIRATSVEQAREVVEMYFSKGYKQIKIYNSIEPDVLKVLAEEAHKRGITVTGHVPVAVGNAVDAVEAGMDQFSHSGLFLSALYPDSTITQLGRNFLNEREVSDELVEKTGKFFLENGIVLDPTINLNVVRGVPWEIGIESVEPDAPRIAYELWEGKRFRKGVSPQRAEKAKKGYTRMMEVIGKFHDMGVPIVAGTDNAVPVFCLYLELESYHKLAGLTPLETIQSATIVPARAMGMDKSTGTLEIGKEADIAILDKNPLEDISNLRTVSAVLSNGNYYESAPLWRAADFKPR